MPIAPVLVTAVPDKRCPSGFPAGSFRYWKVLRDSALTLDRKINLDFYPFYPEEKKPKHKIYNPKPKGNTRKILCVSLCHEMLQRMPKFQSLTCFLAHGPWGGVSSSDPTDQSALGYILQLTLSGRTDGYAHIFWWNFRTLCHSVYWDTIYSSQKHNAILSFTQWAEGKIS